MKRECVFCGKKFTPKRVNTKACSPACRKEAHKKYKKQYYADNRETYKEGARPRRNLRLD
jgi:hypothetical protein